MIEGNNDMPNTTTNQQRYNEKWIVLCDCDRAPKEKVLCPDHAAICEIADSGTDVVWAEYITCDVDEPCWVCGE